MTILAPGRSQTAQPEGAPAIPPKSRVYLIDGSGYIFRAFHALPPLTRPSDGLPVGAVHGFCNMLWKLLRETKGEKRPTHLAVIFDHSRVSFRNAISADYKAHRPETPPELVPQFPLIRDAVRAFNVACIEQEGFEADDIIATYACQAAEAGGEVVIVSSDKDLMQLVGSRVSMLDTMKNKEIGEPEVLEKFGVTPDKVVEVQALAGDSVDNVPGVPGIGIKTAAELIREYGDLETLLAKAPLIKQKMRRERLIEFADQARLSRRLVELDRNVPVERALDLTAVEEPDPHALMAFMRSMEFNSLTKRISEAYGVEAPPPGETAPRPDAAQLAPAGGEPHAEKAAPAAGPASELRRVQDWLRSVPFNHAGYTQVTDLQTLEDWIAAATEQGFVAFDTETTDLDAVAAHLCGVALALEPNRACYIPLAHRAGDGLDFTGAGDIAQLPLEHAIPRLKALLEDESVLKIGQNIKYDLVVMRRYGVRLAAYDDTMLLAYAVDQGRGGLAGFGMDELAKRHLGHTPISFADVAGKGKTLVTFDCVPVDKATEYSAEDADVTLRLWHLFKARLAAEGMAAVYETLERPMPAILGEMELAGVKVDRTLLSRLSGEFAQSLARFEDEIYALAGQRFNIGSTMQVADLLFGKFGLPGAKKTATGKWSTGAKVLEELVASEELTPDQRLLPSKLLEWRQLAKLKSTYTELAAPAYRRGDGPHPHLLRAGLHLDRAALLDRAEPAKHPDPHQGRPANPHRLHRRARQAAHLGRLQPDRAARARAHGGHPRVEARLRGGARHPRHDGVRDVRRAHQGHAGRGAAPRQGHQFRHHLRHLGFRSVAAARHRAGRGGRIYRQVFRALPRHPRLYGRDARQGARGRLCRNAVRAENPLPGDQYAAAEHARVLRAGGDQRADPGHGGRYPAPGDDPHAGRARQGGAVRADAAASA